MTDNTALRTLSRIAALIALLATIYRLITSWQQITYDPQIDSFQMSALLSRLLTDIGLAMMAVFVSFRAKSQKGTQLFAMFLAGLVLDDIWYFRFAGEHIGMLLLSFISALTATLFVSAFQYFPHTISKEQILSYIKLAFLRRSMSFLTRSKNMWVVFMPIILSINITCTLLSAKLLMTVVNLLIILCGFSYMYVSYKKVGIDSRSSILWLFWGVLCYVILIIFFAILHSFGLAENTVADSIMTISGHLIVLLMVFMSVFFASSFDTGFIIKRTIVDGALFLLVILVYNVVEHYVLHTINHTLHINDAFLASLLSGVMVLVISPLHHKLTAFLNRKFKSGGGGHGH